MKKVAIFTWCNKDYPNFGQVLQCLALQIICKCKKLDSKVIRYRRLDSSEKISDIPDDFDGRDKYERIIREKKYKNEFSEQNEKFWIFMRDHIDVSKMLYSIEEIKSEIQDCELLIVGSDQLWNPKWFDDIYLLEFADEKQTCISYATGGITVENEENRNVIKRIATNLERFKYVSVREPASASILKKYTKKDVFDVLDPTLLVAEEEWNKYVGEFTHTEKYILCYMLGEVMPHKHLIDNIARKMNVSRIVCIGIDADRLSIADNGTYSYIRGVGPSEFLPYIKNAECICTDSFHAMTFSIVFKRDFYLFRRAYLGDDSASQGRMDNVTEKFGIEDRHICSKADLDKVKPIDYSSISVQIEAQKRKSLAFFEKVIT